MIRLARWKVIVCVLAYVRFGVERRRFDLYLFAGFFVTAMTTLAFSIAPALDGNPVAASETGRSNAAAARGLLPGGTGGMLVLDVSRSIKPESNRTITGVLQTLIQAKSRIGLVAFQRLLEIVQCFRFFQMRLRRRQVVDHFVEGH